MSDFPENHIEIYQNAILIDGREVLVESGSFTVEARREGDTRSPVTLTLLPETVTFYTSFYERKKNQ